MIISRSISSPGTLSSTSPDEMRLLPLTPFSVTHQPSMMVVPWPNSLLEEIPWYVMLIVKIISSELTTDQSRPHGIKTTGLTNIQTGLELQLQIPSRLHKIEKYEPL